jgi:hypothetical protein
MSNVPQVSLRTKSAVTSGRASAAARARESPPRFRLSGKIEIEPMDFRATVRVAFFPPF